MKHARDDNDPDDGFDDGRNHDGPDGHHGHDHHKHGEDNDDNDDNGLHNAYDTPSYENVDAKDDAPLSGGQVVEYPVATSSLSLALIATATADDPLAQIGIDIFDPSGLFVANSAPTPGIAVATVPLPAPGNYKVRVHNYGLTPIVASPTTIVREPWQP
jgi:hypothetical protein